MQLIIFGEWWDLQSRNLVQIFLGAGGKKPIHKINDPGAVYKKIRSHKSCYGYYALHSSGLLQTSAKSAGWYPVRFGQVVQGPA